MVWGGVRFVAAGFNSADLMARINAKLDSIGCPPSAIIHVSIIDVSMIDETLN